MKKIFKKINILSDESGLQDVIFLGVIFLFISILIIGLFPGKNMGTVISQEFFIYFVMTVPVVAALYLIVISFRKNFYTESTHIASSIRKKMALAFVFVAVLPSLPIVFISNYLLNQNLSNLIFDKTSNALNEAISMSNEQIINMNNRVTSELESLKYQIGSGGLALASKKGRDNIRNIYKIKGIPVIFYQIESGHNADRIRILDYTAGDFQKGLTDFYSLTDLNMDIKVDKISISKRDYIAGSLRYNRYLVVMCNNIPDAIPQGVELYTQSLADNKRLVNLINDLKSNSGIYLFGISIGVIMISVLVSLYLSKNIVKPVLQLSDASKEIASGNFSITIHRESEDELGLLFKSFNRMVQELDRNRKAMYHKQRLEAWREMARRVVHEIKNPLTPIRLSAERMRNKFLENHTNIKEIILSGTETIIEEVQALMSILSEFTKFARLPEMKPIKTDINPLIENCVSFFSGHENINFSTEIDEKIPEIYIDKVLIKQTLNNIIQNAIEAIENRGAINIKSEFIESNGNRLARITIADDGTGIRDFDKDRIFNPGFSTKPSGTGLGLAIVEKIIMEHQGEIYCRSEYGRGTEFIIDLPIDNEESVIYGKNTGS